MISRRNTRIKVLQTLYAHSRNPGMNSKEAETMYQRMLSDSYKLFLLNLLVINEVNAYNRLDTSQRATKYLPTEVDKIVDNRLFENPVAQALANNNKFRRQTIEMALGGKLNSDITRKLYRAFAETEDFVTYMKLEEPSIEDHRNAQLALYRVIRNSEIAQEFFEDNYSNAEEDESLVQGAIKRTIKSLPDNDRFCEDQNLDPEITQEFGLNLLITALREDKELSDMIAPCLRGWEADRVAVMDMLLIKMALVEFMNFETIPVKASLNEYVDLTKTFSTPKSKEFVNGILDRLMRDLQSAGKIQKQGRGLVWFLISEFGFMIYW